MLGQRGVVVSGARLTPHGTGLRARRADALRGFAKKQDSSDSYTMK